GVKFVQTVWQAGAPQPARSPGELDETEGTSESGGRPERGRGLFGLLPSLLGAGDDAAGAAQREPPIEDVTASAAESGEEDREPPRTPVPAWPPRPQAKGSAPQTAPGTLARDSMRKLQATLSELAECRRLLDEILTDPESA